MDPALWLTFAGASLVLAVAPGPDNLFVLAQSAVYGVRAGLTVVLGLCTGLVVQTICAACGVAAVVAAVPALFWGIRIAGACYLIYLAWMAWTHAVSDSEGPQGTALTGMALWRRGVIMNITNPKVQIFFLAFFPQFVTRGASSLQTACEMTVLGVTFMIVTLLVFSLIAFCAGSVAEKLRTPRVQFYLNRTAAVIFACLAAGTLLS